MSHKTREDLKMPDFLKELPVYFVKRDMVAAPAKQESKIEGGSMPRASRHAREAPPFAVGNVTPGIHRHCP